MSIKKCLHAILMGIQTGSAVYLIVLAFSIQKHPPTTSNIISVIVMNSLIGIISSILKTLEDRFPFLVSILLHFASVAVLACCFMVYNNWGFLIFNWKPAKIFMGDVGSLALGAGLAIISLMLHHEWSLLGIGIVFVLETASVIIQVTSFKLTGKRVFKMSPIHHHFEMCGWKEVKIVLVFSLVGLIGTLITLVFI